MYFFYYITTCVFELNMFFSWRKILMRLCFKEFIYLLSFKFFMFKLGSFFFFGFGEIRYGQTFFFIIILKRKTLRGFPVSICTTDHDRLTQLCLVIIWRWTARISLNIVVYLWSCRLFMYNFLTFSLYMYLVIKTDTKFTFLHFSFKS